MTSITLANLGNAIKCCLMIIIQRMMEVVETCTVSHTGTRCGQFSAPLDKIIKT